MTYRARKVLDDCRLALSLMEEETDFQRWRIHWAAAVALIRAVGHVLDKVDGADLIIKQVAAASFRRWTSDDPEHEIFREFIERERNNLRKEYHSDVHPLGEVSVAVEITAQPISGGGPMRFGRVAEIGDNIYRPLLDGPWQGNDARDVPTEAIEWWRRQLDGIDRGGVKRRTGA